jgi:pimeloyl-ACP methyl ester carboxylesterase
MLYTLDAGSPTKTAIVFLHGGGLSSKSWLPVIERLPDFHCLAPDLPEQGQSVDIPFTMKGAAYGVAEIIRLLLPNKTVHVVGLSLGGAVALTLLQIAPELVDHVIVTGSSGRLSRLTSAFAKSMLWLLRFYTPEKLVQATLRQQGIPAQYHALLHDDLLKGSNAKFMRHLISELVTLELPQRINVPLLICVGEKENYIAKGIARDLLERYPSASGIVAPNGSHAWCLQFPDLFADTVRAWVTDNPLPSILLPM